MSIWEVVYFDKTTETKRKLFTIRGFHTLYADDSFGFHVIPFEWGNSLDVFLNLERFKLDSGENGFSEIPSGFQKGFWA